MYAHANAAHLSNLLEAAPADKRKMVVTDSVFSMDGASMPLLCVEYLRLLFLFSITPKSIHMLETGHSPSETLCSALPVHTIILACRETAVAGECGCVWGMC